MYLFTNLDDEVLCMISFHSPLFWWGQWQIIMLEQSAMFIHTLPSSHDVVCQTHGNIVCRVIGIGRTIVFGRAKLHVSIAHTTHLHNTSLHTHTHTYHIIPDMSKSPRKLERAPLPTPGYWMKQERRDTGESQWTLLSSCLRPKPSW